VVPHVAASGRGGSMYMTMKRVKQQACKLAVGGRPLTDEEQKTVTMESRAEYDAMKLEKNEQWDNLKSRYMQEVADRQQGVAQPKRASRAKPKAEKPPQPHDVQAPTHYIPQFGHIGTPTLPISPATVLAFHKAKGFPDDRKIYKSLEFIIGPEQCMDDLKGLGTPPPHHTPQQYN
jgi:hypothetical protein